MPTTPNPYIFTIPAASTTRIQVVAQAQWTQRVTLTFANDPTHYVWEGSGEPAYLPMVQGGTGKTKKISNNSALQCTALFQYYHGTILRNTTVLPPIIDSEGGEWDLGVFTEDGGGNDNNDSQLTIHCEGVQLGETFDATLVEHPDCDACPHVAQAANSASQY